MQNLDELKSKFIIEEQKYTQKLIQEHTEKLLKFAKISKNGDVFIEDKSLLPDDKLRLSLVVRFIAFNWDKNISKVVTLSDVMKVLPNERKEAVGSRMSKLVSEGFARKVSRGEYEVLPYKVGLFIDNLGTGLKNIGSKKKYNKDAKRDKKLTGVGKYILELIEKGFFDKPRTIKETEEELKVGGNFYDSRVIDATIRNIFMKNKKLLTRLRSIDNNKARWQYIKTK